MFHEDPEFVPPRKNIHTPIWRYMDFTQFMSLLETQCLHFTRPDVFDDPFEGCMPKRVLKDFEETDHLTHDALLHIFKGMRANTCVSCWHANTDESEAMWKLYLKSNEGIAIRSTYAKLSQSFDDAGDVAIHVGKVRYRDYEKARVPLRNFFALLMYKRRSFRHEEEVRAIAYEVQPSDAAAFIWKHQPINPAGKEIAVNLRTLIDAIHVAPSTPTWFKALVEKIVERYGFGIPVCQSSLDQVPVWPEYKSKPLTSS